MNLRDALIAEKQESSRTTEDSEDSNLITISSIGFPIELLIFYILLINYKKKLLFC